MNFFAEAYAVGVANMDSRTTATTTPTISTIRISLFRLDLLTVLGCVGEGMPPFVDKASRPVLLRELLDSTCNGLLSNEKNTSIAKLRNVRFGFAPLSLK